MPVPSAGVVVGTEAFTLANGGTEQVLIKQGRQQQQQKWDYHGFGNSTISATASNYGSVGRLGLAYCATLLDHAQDVLLHNSSKQARLSVAEFERLR